MRWNSSVRPPWMPSTMLLTLQPGPMKAASKRAEARNSSSAVRLLFSPCASVPRIWEDCMVASCATPAGSNRFGALLGSLATLPVRCSCR